MIVTDASVIVEFLRETGRATARIGARLSSEPMFHVPAIFELEVTQALRGIELRGEDSRVRIDQARLDLRQLRTARYDPLPFLPRIWSLRHNLTVYDAAYVALAEVLDATLLTTDARLARSSGHRAEIELLPA